MNIMKTSEIIEILEGDFGFTFAQITVYKSAICCQACKDITSLGFGQLSGIEDLTLDSYLVVQLSDHTADIVENFERVGLCERCQKRRFVATMDKYQSQVFKLVNYHCVIDLGISQPAVSFYSQASSKIRGYQQGGDRVCLNLFGIDASQLLKFANTIAHEYRHVYQKQFDPYILDSYIDGSVNYDGYYNHPSEIDARDYGEKVSMELLDEVTHIVKMMIEETGVNPYAGVDTDGDQLQLA